MSTAYILPRLALARNLVGADAEDPNANTDPPASPARIKLLVP